MSDDLGDRMKKNYEDRARHYLLRRTPVIIRVDGKAFHTFTCKFNKPFDEEFIEAMTSTALETAEGLQGFKAAYIQSDECSFLLTDYDKLDTDAWFGYNQSKIESIMAAMFSVRFNLFIRMLKPTIPENQLAVFDARAFNVPKEEVVNYFLWRAKDWQRNSLSMYCQAFFSQKELQGKNAEQQHEMLHGIGKNWTTDNDARIKNGTFISNDAGNNRIRHDITPSFEAIFKVIGPLLEPKGEDDGD